MNIGSLLPDTLNPLVVLDHLRNENPSDHKIAAEGLKDLFILLMMSCFLYGFLKVIIQSIQSWFKAKPYLSVLKGSDVESQIYSSQLPLYINLRKHLIEVSSLVDQRTSEKKRTIDASEIITEAALAPKYITSRLILALPSVLTGLGVLGTFVGLALGMGGIDLSGGSDKVMQEVPPLIEVFAVAFSCSVYGVGASLLFSIFEKTAEGVCLNNIYKIQNKIDSIFVRYVPEDSLLSLSISSRKTERHLEGLANAIGEAMQEAIGRLGTEIKEAVTKATAEGQQPLMEKSAEMLSAALTKELMNLKEQIGTMGQQFSEKFSGASNELMESVQSFKPTIEMLSSTVSTAQKSVNQSVEKLNSHEAVMSEMAKAAANIEKAAIAFGEMKVTLETSSNRNEEAARFQDTAARTNEKVAIQFEKIGEGLPEIRDTIKMGAEVIGSLGAPVRDLQAMLTALPKQQEAIDAARATTETERNDKILLMSTNLANKVGEAAEKFAEVGSLADQLSAAAKSLDDASRNLSEFGDNVSVASRDQLRASEISRDAAIASEKTAKTFEPIPESISRLTAGLESAGEGVRAGAEAASHSYEKLIVLQKEWFSGMEVGLVSMKESLQEVIKQYGQDVEGETSKLMLKWTKEVDDCLQSYDTQLQQFIDGVEQLQEALSKLEK